MSRKMQIAQPAIKIERIIKQLAYFITNYRIGLLQNGFTPFLARIKHTPNMSRKYPNILVYLRTLGRVFYPELKKGSNHFVITLFRSYFKLDLV